MWKSWDEFVADVERGEAERQDRGESYDVGNGILRALHHRVASLESSIPVQPQLAEAGAPEQPPAP
jgi:hypothetical protein